MSKKKYLKLSLVIMFIVLAGILYSCRSGGKDEIAFITNKAADREDAERNNSSFSTQIKEISNTEDIVEEKVSENTNTSDSVTGSSKTKESSNEKNASKYIYVHICGEVLKPDVYKVKENTRVYEVIAKAGGFTNLAADSYMNQAAIVTDGQQIYIPSMEEAKDLPAGITNIPKNENAENTSNKNTGTVNINIATADELMTLSGVGQAKAQAIIDYRNSNGNFLTIDEIKNIDGIKDAVFNKIKDKISVK